jgi:hypothetical protein
MKELYAEIKAHLERLGVIAHVDLWRNQIGNLEQESVFAMPAVFIQFSSNEVKTATYGIQRIRMTVTFHVCFEAYINPEKALDITDLIDTIHGGDCDQNEGLQGFEPTNGGAFTRTALETAEEFNNVSVWRMNYDFEYTDNTGHKNKRMKQYDEPQQLHVNIEVE